MAKKINLPKTQISSQGDLITILQNGVEKNISKTDLLKQLETSIASINSEMSSVKQQISKRTVNKSNPTFNSPVTAGEPSSPKQLTTKRYVDSKNTNVLKIDGTTPLLKNLSYRTSPTNFKSNDVVTRKFVDDNLKNTLKTIQRYSSILEYPKASAGDSFVITQNSNVFAEDGPEVQSGDLIICVESSEGGAHSQVGDQFTILNTNVVFSTEEKAGILRVANDEDIELLESENSAITPLKYKRALETNSSHNRIVVNVPSYSVTERDKGIIGVDTSQQAVTLTLPSIGRLENPKLVKYTIKDESNNATKNTITIVCSGGNTIQGQRTYILSTSGESIKLYNDQTNKWYVESNVSSTTSSSGGVKSFITSDVVGGEKAANTGSYESVMSIDVDLREYPVGTGFKVVSHCASAGNGNTKTVAIGVNGTAVLPSSLTGTTAPNNKFIHHEVTVLHSDTPQYMAFGFVMMSQDDSAAALTNVLELDWDSKIIISVEVNNAGAASDISVYALQVIPLK
tara:strand:+ start:124 stop:1662 length:1539 start_codon:yes stop_codon:yes gene_type:complete